MKNILRYSIVLAVALSWACTPTGPVGPVETSAALTGQSLDGKKIDLADYKGKVVLVDFWATWCDPCKAEIPELIKLQGEYGPKGFAVIGVSMDEDAAEVPPFVKKAKFNYPVILNGSERAPKGWVVPGLPTAYLIGRDGKVLTRTFGVKSFTKLRLDLDAALGQK